MKTRFDPFLLLCAVEKLPPPEKEVAVVAGRKWRFDYAWPIQFVALEIEGGIWTQGRHTRPQGFERDCEKYAAAVLLGWRLFRASPRQAHDGTAIGWLREAFRQRHHLDGGHLVVDGDAAVDAADRVRDLR